MLFLDHAKNLQEKRPPGWFDWQDSTAEAIEIFSKLNPGDHLDFEIGDDE